MDLERVPTELLKYDQWVCWTAHKEGGKYVDKKPLQPDGAYASTSDPNTWYSFQECRDAVGGRVLGVGFVFSADDTFCGVDLDDCRNPDTGVISSWAQEILDRVDSYSEISPSQTGIKIICRGEMPIKGRRVAYQDGGIETYCTGRYFTITGQSTNGSVVKNSQEAIDWIQNRFFAKTTKLDTSRMVERCWRSLERIDDSIQGQDGSGRIFNACCEILRHGLAGQLGQSLLIKFNSEKCNPPWPADELKHKWDDAVGQAIRNSDFGIRHPEFGTLGTDGQPQETFTCPITSANELIKNPIKIDYLIPDVMVAGQPLLVGGAHKSLKTSIMLDLAMSLSSGSDFLGRYPVDRTVPVLVLSGESGQGTIGETLGRIAEAKGITDVGPLHIGFDLPAMADPQHLRVIKGHISTLEAGVLVIDPAYLSLLRGADRGISASDVFAMGALLQRITSFCNSLGVSLVLCHHTTKAARRPGPHAPTLNELSMAGFSEWARQWLLVGRRRAYDFSGVHQLVVGIGGSAGHASEPYIDIDEGDEADRLLGRKWVITFPGFG